MKSQKVNKKKQFSAWKRANFLGGRHPLYSEAGVSSLQTTHLPQHR